MRCFTPSIIKIMKRLNIHVWLILLFLTACQSEIEDYEDVQTMNWIAHAGGTIESHPYSNSLEALNKSYQDGFRYFELDLIEDRNGEVVAAHDWDFWKSITACDSAVPVNREHYIKHKIYHKYTPMDMQAINLWFAEHSDAVLVTDKIDDPKKLATLFVDKSRLLMELFTFDAIKQAQELDVQFMLSDCLLNQIQGDKLKYFMDNEIPAIAVCRSYLEDWSYRKFFVDCKRHGIKVYVFCVNFEPDKDEKYVFENEKKYISGMYADKWIKEFEYTDVN